MTNSPADWPLKKITANQVLGSRGEAFVSFLLSKHCLVRPVANGTDIGVDLYCEVLKGGIPHNHFWVQVKSSRKQAGRAKSLKISDLEYWSRQPIPVFVFFMAVDESLSTEKFRIEVIDLTEQFIREPFIDPHGKKRKKIPADFGLTSLAHIDTFLFERVPTSASRIHVRDGFIFEIKRTVHQSYVKRYEARDIRRFSKAFIKNVGRTCGLLLSDICHSEEREEFSSARDHLEQILEAFNDSPNSDFHYWLGYSKMIDGRDNEGALRCFEKALSRIESDKRIPVSDTANERALIALFIMRLKRRLKIK